MMMHKLFLALFAMLVFAMPANAAPTLIAPGTEMPAQTCYIGSEHINWRASVMLGGDKACGPDMKIADGKYKGTDYRGFRLPPMTIKDEYTWSGTPINMYGYCFYVRNRTKNTYFVPADKQMQLESFIKHRPDGVDVKMCPTTDLIYQSGSDELCGGTLVTAKGQAYSDGMTVIPRLLGMKKYFYYVVTKDRQYPRTLTITSGRNGDWIKTFTGVCPPKDMSPEQLNNLDSAAGFDRNAPQGGGRSINATPSVNAAPAVTPASTQQRVPVTDGALVRNITPQSQPTQRVFITDGALVRNIH